MFVDESTNEFDFTLKQWDSFMWYLHWTNEQIYGTRNLQGFDDEFDDEY